MISTADKYFFNERMKQIKSSEWKNVTCSKCKGNGTIFKNRASKRYLYRKCSTCNGTGFISKGYVKSHAVVDLFYKGYTRAEIADFLTVEFKLSENVIKNIMRDAFYYIENEHSAEIDDVLTLHYKRYEALYRKNAEIDFEKIPKQFRNLKMFETLNTMLDILQAKEKSFGMHNKNFSFQLNEYNIFKNRLEKVNKYDFSKLSLDELLELKTMLERSKEVDSIEHIKTDETERFLEMPVEKREEPIDFPVKEIETTNKRKKLNDNKIKSKTLNQVRESMDKEFKKKMKIALKKAGSKTIDNE